MLGADSSMHRGSSLLFKRQPALLRGSPSGRKVPSSCQAKPEDAGAKDWESLMTPHPTLRPTSMFASDYVSRRCLPSTGQEVSVSAFSAVPLTLYSLRMETSAGGGSALSNRYSAVNVLLLASDGRSILHRVSPVNDPVENAKTVEDFCKIVGGANVGVGVNCQAMKAMRHADPSSTNPTSHPAACTLRFREGRVDEVSFLAPELGPLSGILIGPESGTWVVDEIQLSSSRTKHVDRFVCRRRLGSARGQGAAWLTPVPQTATFYGDYVMHESQQEHQHQQDQQRQEEQLPLLLTTFMLSVAGTGLADLLGGIHAAWPVATGGMLGLIYQYLLQQGVNEMALSSPLEAANAAEQWESADDVQFDYASSTNGLALALMGSPAVRLLFVALSAYLAVTVAVHNDAQQVCDQAACIASDAYPPSWQLALGVLGFMTQKLTMVGVSLRSPHPVDFVTDV